MKIARRSTALATGRPLLLFVIALALVPPKTTAQGLTGSLSGTVKDPQGGVLPGAVVRVVSDALIGGDLQTTTSERGQWRFPVLTPGVYSLTVDLAPSFAPYRQEGISIGAGATLDRAVVLEVAGVAQRVTVEGHAGVDSWASGLETRFGSDYIPAIPTRRFSMFDLIRSAPGVSPTSPASGSVNTVSVFGSSVNENMFMIDGTNFTCPCQGVSRAEPIVDVIQEVQVQSTGASVEFGNLQGGVINVVTKQGGTRFQHDTAYYGQSSGLTAQPIVRPVSTGTGYERIRYRDFTTGLGGPIQRDRAWFFGGYQYLRDYDSQPGADPNHPKKYEQNKVFGKVTWKPTPSMQLMHSFHEEKWVNPTVPTAAIPFIATQRVHASVPGTTFANLTHVPSSNTMWEARMGRFVVHQDTDPSSGNFETPPHRDSVTGIWSANAQQTGAVTFDRITAKALLHRYQQGWLDSDHHFKVGTQIERGEHVATQAFPGGVQYVDSTGAPFQAIFRDPWILGGRFVTTALFASDSISVTDRITVDAGLRFDHNRAISQDVGGVDAFGHKTSAVTKGRGPLYTWNVLSPRLGVSAKLPGDGRTMLRANYGRFAQGVLTGELDVIHPGVTPIRTMAYEQATGGYTRLVSVVDPTINLAHDPRTKAPRTDEFSVAVDRQITSSLTASAAYIRKRGRDFIGWTDTGGQYQKETRTLADGTIVPVLVLTNGTAARRFLLTNPDGLFVNYDGMVVAMEKRLSKTWQASGSYTFSRAYGRQVTSNATAAEAQFSTIARPAFLAFGQDPNDLTNTIGRLPNDRPHVFRATSVVHLPWQGVLVSANLQYFTGRPWAATTQLTLPQGSQRILLEPRGSRRLSSQSLLDFRVSKTVRLGNTSHVDLLFDVLNLLNDTAEEALASDNRAAANFGQATVFMDPRRVMLGVRLNLGR